MVQIFPYVLTSVNSVLGSKVKASLEGKVWGLSDTLFHGVWWAVSYHYSTVFS